jgi:hypothetical protein
MGLDKMGMVSQGLFPQHPDVLISNEMAISHHTEKEFKSYQQHES